MNNKVNYTLVGVVVLLGSFLMFAFTYWMLKPSSESETQTYAIYFKESVFGLNVEAPVKYRGVSVGKVIKLRINPKNPEEVEVLISVLKTTPVKVNTVARLTAQGITGLTYINLSLGAKDAPPLQKKENQEYPVIGTVPSFFENFENSLGSVSGKLSSTLGKTEQLLGESNQKHLAQLLEHTASVAKKLDMMLDKPTITSVQNSIKNLESLSQKMDTVVPNINKLVDKSIAWQDSIAFSFNSIMNSYLGIRSSMDEIKRAVSSGEFNVKAIAQEIVPPLNNTLEQMQDVLIETQDLLEQYQRSPSDIIYKQETQIKAPGE